MNDIRSSVYAQKVELLLRLIPIVMEEHVFAIHGGTAINLFLKDLPRYSVDIDLTYIPLADRQTSLDDMAKTEHSHPLGMVVSTHFRCGKGVKRGLKNGALPFKID